MLSCRAWPNACIPGTPSCGAAAPGRLELIQAELEFGVVIARLLVLAWSEKFRAAGRPKVCDGSPN